MKYIIKGCIGGSGAERQRGGEGREKKNIDDGDQEPIIVVVQARLVTVMTVI